MCLLRLFLLCWIYSISLQSKVLMLTTEYFSIETFQLVCELNSYFLMHSWKDRRFFVSSWLVVTESSRLEWDEWFQHFSDWSYESWQRPLWNNSRKASISIQTLINISDYFISCLKWITPGPSDLYMFIITVRWARI